MPQNPFKWSRCRNGYEIDDDGVVVPISDDMEDIEPFAKLNSILLRKLAEKEDDEDCLFFVDEFGLLEDPREMPLAIFKSTANSMRIMLGLYDKAIKMKDGQRRRSIFEEIAAHYNGVSWGATQAKLATVPGYPPVLKHDPKNLMHALWVEYAEMMRAGIGHQKCDWHECGKWYIPKRKRRKDAKHSFCCNDHRQKFVNLQASQRKKEEKR